MALEQPVNGVGTTLASSITTSSTTLSLTSATGFTNAQYHLLAMDQPTVAASTHFEIMEATALSGSNLTVTRNVESFAGVQTAYAFSAGATILIVPSVASILAMIAQSIVPANQVANVTVTVTNSATPAMNTNNGNIFSLTGLSQNITSWTTNLTGTPTINQIIEVQITDNGTARGITWGASFRSTTQTLPTTTVAGAILRVAFQWNALLSTWDCIGAA